MSDMQMNEQQTDERTLHNDAIGSEREVPPEDTVEVNESEPDVLAGEVEPKEIEIPSEYIYYNNEEISEAEAYMGTTEAAKKLGIHRNSLYGYCRSFGDLLAIKENTDNGYIRFTDKSIKQLQFIIHDLRQNNRTYEQERAFLESKAGRKSANMVVETNTTIEAMFNQMQKNLMEQQKQLIQEQAAMISETVASRLSEKQEALLLSDKQISESYGNLEKQVVEIQSEMQKMGEQITAKDNQLLEKEKEIAALRQEIAQRDAAEEERKKKKFFLFRK